MKNRVSWTPDLVNRFWDEVSQTRLAEKSFSHLVPGETYAIFSPFMNESRRYLDYGAGDGAFAAFLIERGFSVAIFEPSPERAGVARARLERMGDRFLGVVTEPGVARFDGVFALEVFEHIDPSALPAALDLLHGLTYPDSHVFVTTPNKEDLDSESCIDPVSLRFFHRWQHVRSFDRDSLNRAMTEAGFAPLVVHEVDLDARVFEGLRRATGFADAREVFDTLTPMKIGDGDRLAGVFLKQDVSNPKTPRPTCAPVEFTKRWEIAAPHGPVGAYRADGSLRLSPFPAHELRMDEIAVNEGFGWVAAAPPEFGAGDDVGIRRSALLVLEDGAPLGPPASSHQSIRSQGEGRYSHWGGTLLFSTSDNSDPRSNGRTYSLRLPGQN